MYYICSMESLIVNWNVNPAIFHIGGFELRWYSLLFVSGFILGWFIMKSFFGREKISEALLDPMLYMLLICTIVGARLGHCLFYEPDYYLAPFVQMFGGTVSPQVAARGMTNWQAFWEIFMPWKGGLASHGGTIAIILGIIWYARKYGSSTQRSTAVPPPFPGVLCLSVTEKLFPAIPPSYTRLLPISSLDSSLSGCTVTGWKNFIGARSSAYSLSCASAAAFSLSL